MTISAGPLGPLRTGFRLVGGGSGAAGGTERYRLDANTRIDGEWIDPLHADADLFLADTLADPTERRNLAAGPRHASIRNTMVSELRAALADLADAPRLESRPSIATEFRGA